MLPTILSIQSWVATGHVGNAAAIFPLQRLGAEVHAIHTVQFSNHPGHGAFTGQAYPGPHTAALVDGIEARGLLPKTDALLSGYLGDAGSIAAVTHAADRLRAANPAALYCCDPVIGDTTPGVFVRPEIPALIHSHLVPRADILTPNLFELEHLTQTPCPTLAETRTAIAGLQSRMPQARPRIVLVTSLALPDTPENHLDLLAASPTELWRLRVPRLPIAPNGAGDAVAALFLLHILRTASLPEALANAGSAIAAILRRTAAAHAPELLLVQAQDELANPTIRYTPERL